LNPNSAFFILYGGTALALRLGHRISEDFDFFSFAPLDPTSFQRSQHLLASGETLQLEPNTLSVLVSEADDTVKLSFFGGLTFRQIQEPDTSADGVCRVASLPDLFATKLNTVYQRAEAKDYLDIHAILRSGWKLEQGLEFAQFVYGPNFNAMLPLQALCYFEEPGLKELPGDVKEFLRLAVGSVK
jgi:predicted nucleotidyltransferase component of viral defense system